MDSGCIAVDLDGTLAFYQEWKGPTQIGKPIAPMVARVQQWLQDGEHVVIFTARVWPLGTTEEKAPPQREDFDDPEKFLQAHYRHESGTGKDRSAQARAAKQAIEQWCEENLGQVLEVTCIKRPEMTEFWDDRAVSVTPNQGTALNHPAAHP